MTTIQAAELARDDARTAIDTLHRLVREAMSQVAAARADVRNAQDDRALAEVDRDRARDRADKMSQILQGAAGLCEQVRLNVGSPAEWRELAIEIAERIEAL